MESFSELQQVFSRNLNEMIGPKSNISRMAREMGVNRAQLNRYRSGESVPQPGPLSLICQYFGVDARILTTPLDQIRQERCQRIVAQSRSWAVEQALLDLRAVIEESDGVAGFHRNGAVATWEELGLSVERIEEILSPPPEGKDQAPAQDVDRGPDCRKDQG